MLHDADRDRSLNRAQSVIMDLSFNIGENHSSEPVGGLKGIYVPLRRMESYNLLHQRPKAERKNFSGLPEYANCERWAWDYLILP